MKCNTSRMRYILSKLCLLVCLQLIATSTQANLVSHWPLDVCSLDGSANEVVDVTSGYNGSSIGGVSASEDGQYCQSSQLLGSGGHLSFPHQNDYASQSGTVMFWFKADDLSHSYQYRNNGQGLFSRDSTNYDSGGHLTIWLQTNGSIKVRQQSTSADYIIESSSGLISANQWYHLAYSWGDVNGDFNLYLNGVLINTISGFSTGTQGNSEPIIIGASASGSENNGSTTLYDYFKGYFDDIRFYDSSLSNTDITNVYQDAQYTCSNCPDAPAPNLVSQWPLDVCSLDGSVGEIVDVISGLNGNSVGGATTSENGQYCHSGVFAGAGEHLYIPHDDQFESQTGTFSFWFKADDLSHSYVSSYGAQGLFSKDSSGNDTGGHLSIWLKSNGSIEVRQQSTTTSYTSTTSSGIVSVDQWHYLAYSWGDDSDNFRIHLDGVLVKTFSGFSSGTEGNNEPIIIGANAYQTENLDSSPANLKDFFKGEIDDIRFYDSNLSDSDITDIYQQAEYDCTSCGGSDELISHWPLDVCSLDGTANEVVDIVSGLNGNAVNGAEASSSGQYCQSSEFAGTGEHLYITSATEFGTTDGAVSLWFNTPNLSHSYQASYGGQALISQDAYAYNGGGGHFTLWVFSDGSIDARHQSNDTTAYASTSSGIVSEDTWHNLVYTWGASGIRIYLDGVLRAENTSMTYGTGNREPIIIGANAYLTETDDSSPTYLKDFFKGEIDDIKLFGAQITQSAITELYNQSEYQCESCLGEYGLLSHWPLDVCSLDGTANEVVDVINGYSGLAIDGAAILEDGKFCQSSEFAGVGEHLYIPNTSAFSAAEGAVSFWFKADDLQHTYQPSNGGQALFSRDSSGYDSGGHLSIRVLSAGSVKVRHQDTSSSKEIVSSSGLVAENQWYHLAYSWGSQGMKLYLNGASVGTNTNLTTGLESNSEPIIIGAGATDSENNDSSPANLKDFFKGEMDEIKFFISQINDSAVLELYNQADYSCTNCSVEEGLVAHWPMDLCSLDGTASEVVDVVNGYNGYAEDGASVLETGKFCQTSDFSGLGQHLYLNNVAAFDVADGAVSMWFKTPDLSFFNTQSLGGQTLISRDAYAYNGGGGHFTLLVQSNGSVASRHQSTNTTDYVVTGSSIVSEDTWHHLVYTWGSAGLKIYLDGVLKGSNSSFTYGTDNDEPIIIGANAYTSETGDSSPANLTDFFQGQIDEIKYYGIQIDSTKVSELYQQNQYDCDGCAGTQLVAHYTFEEEEWSGSDAVLDTSSNANHATHLGSATPVNPSEQIACQALDVPYSTSSSSQNGIDTGITPNELGTSGTISFWYRSNQAWNSGSSRQLFDASTTTDNRYFDLVLTSGGKLKFALEDNIDDDFTTETSSSLSYPADEWVHIAITWDIADKPFEIYLNGVKQTVSSSLENSDGLPLAEFQTIYIGDNRSGYRSVGGSTNSADGQFDDVRIYNYAQPQAAIANDMDDKTSCSYVYKYQIQHDASGLTCEAEQITIKACADEQCSSLYDEDITVDMLPNSGWPNGGSVTIPASTATTVDFNYTAVGTVTFDVTGDTAENATECIGNTGNSCNMLFADSGFQFIGAIAADPFADQISESTFTSAQLRAVKTDDTGGSNVCVAALEGTQNVTFALQCDDPASCLTPIVTNSNNISSTGTHDVDVVFNDQGIALLADFAYADAGEITLTASADIGDFSVSAASTQFIVYPDRLNLSVTGADANTPAGQDFAVVISAIGSQGGVLPNYQPEQMQFQLTRLSPLDNGDNVDGTLTYAGNSTISSAIATASFVDSAINVDNNNVTSNGGLHGFTANYSEYGQLSFDIQDADYFGYTLTSATSNQSSPATLGLFVPAYFAVQSNTPTLADQCSITSSFTYLGQNLGFGTPTEITVTAMNALGQPTVNFQSDSNWNWLSGVSASGIELSDPNHSGTVSFWGTPDFNVSNENVLGSRLLTINNAQVIYSKTSNPVAPFSSAMSMQFLPSFFTDNTLGVDICYHANYTANAPDDCDNGATVSALDDTNNLYSTSAISGANLRWGRLVLSNSFGPETEDLLVPVTAEYYDGARFVKNLDDSCTALNLSGSDFETQDMNGAASGSISVLGSNFTLINGQTLSFEGINVRNTDQTVKGEYRIELQPTNDSTITWDDYLQFDWNGAEADYANPTAIITFGQFRGNDRIIHWREVTN